MKANIDTECPMVSVVMVAYNSAKYIDEAIAGVVRQKVNFSVELLVMDDCSTDSTPEIARHWAAKYPHIVKYVRNPRNLGSQGNYLAGFALCRGKYVALCDADDYWCSRRKLSRQVTYMESHPECALTCHRVINYYEATGEKSFSNGGQKNECTAVDLSRSNFITNLSVIYRRELVDLKNLPAWILDHKAPDYALHMLYAVKGSIHFFGRPMGVYRKVTGAIWSTTSEYRRLKMALDMRIALMRELEAYPEVQPGLRDASKAIVRAMMRCVSSNDERAEVTEYARLFDIELEMSGNAVTPAPKKGAVSRLVRRISRFVPRPRP